MQKQYFFSFKLLFLWLVILAFHPSANAMIMQDTEETVPSGTYQENAVQSIGSSTPTLNIKYFSRYKIWDHKTNIFLIKQINTTSQISLGSELIICTKGLHEWIQAGNDPNSLRIFLSGYMLPNFKPVSISPGSQEHVNRLFAGQQYFLAAHRLPNIESMTNVKSSQEYVKYLLKFNEDDKEGRLVWTNIVASARSSQDHKISISLGHKDKQQAFESNVYVKIKLYPKSWPVIVVLPIVLLFVILRLAWKGPLLRDTSLGESHPAIPSPFSLAKVQMAWWFYLVFAAFVYIWLVTQTPPPLTTSVLGLLGISATTGIGAVAVDRMKYSNENNKRKELELKINSLNERMRRIESFPKEIKSVQNDAKSNTSKALIASMQKDLESQLSYALEDFKLLPPIKTSNKKNILDDGDGISLHRLQILVWTILLGIIFICAVYKDFSMPEFDASILALMGISSGTYLGFKFPEKK